MKRNLARKWYIWITSPHHSPFLKETKAGSSGVTEKTPHSPETAIILRSYQIRVVQDIGKLESLGILLGKQNWETTFKKSHAVSQKGKLLGLLLASY